MVIYHIDAIASLASRGSSVSSELVQQEITYASFCCQVFSHSKVSGEAAAATKRAELIEGTSKPSSGDDEHKIDPTTADANPMTPSPSPSPSAFSPSDAEAAGSATDRLSLNLASEQCGAILSKLCEHHDLYLVCQLSGLLGTPSSSSPSSVDGASAFSSSETSTSHDEATKCVALSHALCISTTFSLFLIS